MLVQRTKIKFAENSQHRSRSRFRWNPGSCFGDETIIRTNIHICVSCYAL